MTSEVSRRGRRGGCFPGNDTGFPGLASDPTRPDPTLTSEPNFHILSAAAPGPAVPRGRPARRKSSRNPPRNPPRNTITHGSHGPLFMHTTMHTTRRHEPYTLLKSLCQTMSDGSAVTGRQYRDPCVRGVSRSLGRWGVEQAATKNKHLGVPGRPSGWTCREVSTLVCRVHGRV